MPLMPTFGVSKKLDWLTSKLKWSTVFRLIRDSEDQSPPLEFEVTTNTYKNLRISLGLIEFFCQYGRAYS